MSTSSRTILVIRTDLDTVTNVRVCRSESNARDLAADMNDIAGPCVLYRVEALWGHKAVIAMVLWEVISNGGSEVSIFQAQEALNDLVESEPSLTMKR